MAKVVYNSCFGGFSLSREACEAFALAKGLPFSIEKSESLGMMFEHFMLNGEYFSDGRDIPRHDKDLAEVVEKLGEKANGECAELKIREIPDGSLYRISEYDGNESVILFDEQGWIRAE